MDFYVNTAIFEVAMVVFVCIPGLHLYRRLRDARDGTTGGRRKSNVVEMTKLYMGNGGEVNSTNMNSGMNSTPTSSVHPMPNGYQTMGQ